jgi:hypothetical protein
MFPMDFVENRSVCEHAKYSNMLEVLVAKAGCVTLEALYHGDHLPGPASSNVLPPSIAPVIGNCILNAYIDSNITSIQKR